MTPVTPTFVDDLASALLVSAVASLTDPPTRQYVEHRAAGAGSAGGLCDRLVVIVTSLGVSAGRPVADGAAGRPGATPLRRVVGLEIELVQCGAPTPGTSGKTTAMPSAAVIDAYALARLTEGWELFDGLLVAWRAKTIFGAALDECCNGLAWGQLVPVGPEGGSAGWRWPLTVTV